MNVVQGSVGSSHYSPRTFINVHIKPVHVKIGETLIFSRLPVLVLTIPDTLGGLPVTVIGNNAFDGCDTITCVTTGDNVWLIEREAFANMPNLACTYISDSVTTIKESVWKNDTSLGVVVFGSGVETILNRTLCPAPSRTAKIL